MNKLFFKYFIYYVVVFIRRQKVFKYLAFYKKSQYWDADKIKNYQFKKLKELLAYSKHNIPYYQELDALNQVNDLNKIDVLPTIKKNQIKENPSLFATTINLKNITHKTTGGSTGQAITIPKTADSMAKELAATWRGYSWAGIDIGDKQGRFWGLPARPKDRYKAMLIDFVTNRKRCSAFSFSEKDLHIYTEKLKNFNPKYFYGYVSMLMEYAQYFEKNNIEPPFDLKCIITTSEVLTAYQKQYLEKIFNTRVFNEYGSGELGSVAHECEHGSMHVMAENMIVEVMNDNTLCEFNQIGELVITELNNKAMPLIRYRTGDLASLSDKKCKCGRKLPIIENLVGREYDMIKNKNGKLFHGEFFMYIFEDVKRNNMGIAAFKVKQIDYDNFIIYIKKEDNYITDAETYITNRIRENFDENVNITYHYVDKIDREKSGKMRLIIGMAD